MLSSYAALSFPYPWSYPDSSVLLGPVLHLPIACTLLTLGRTLGVESVFASSPAQCIRLIVFLYTVYYQEWENTFSSTTARLPLRPFLQINVRVACLVTSYGVMGRKTTVFGSLFAKKKVWNVFWTTSQLLNSMDVHDRVKFNTWHNRNIFAPCKVIQLTQSWILDSTLSDFHCRLDTGFWTLLSVEFGFEILIGNGSPLRFLVLNFKFQDRGLRISQKNFVDSGTQIALHRVTWLDLCLSMSVFISECSRLRFRNEQLSLSWQMVMTKNKIII